MSYEANYRKPAGFLICVHVFADSVAPAVIDFHVWMLSLPVLRCQYISRVHHLRSPGTKRGGGAFSVSYQTFLVIHLWLDERKGEDGARGRRLVVRSVEAVREKARFAAAEELPNI